MPHRRAHPSADSPSGQSEPPGKSSRPRSQGAADLQDREQLRAKRTRREFSSWEAAVRLEAAMDEALTAHLAREEPLRLMLRGLLPKSPVDARVNALFDLMKQREYDRDFPFVEPVASYLERFDSGESV